MKDEHAWRDAIAALIVIGRWLKPGDPWRIRFHG
jgi:hypothetical protein